MRVLLISLLISLSFMASAHQTIRLSKDAGTVFIAHNKSILDIKDNSIGVTSKSDQAGCLVYGNWDLSGYAAVKFTITNEDDVHIMQVFSEVADSSCKSTSFTRVQTSGKADHMTTLFPGQTKTVVMDLPAPMPHPEVNQIFYDNYIVGRVRNTPYSLGYRNFSYNVDLKNIKVVGIGIRSSYPGMKFTISDIHIIPGAQKKVPEWMRLDKEHFFPFIDKYGQFKYERWPGKVMSDKDLQKARVAEEKDLAKNPGPVEWSKFGGWKNGPRYEARGSFYAKKIDGKWWLVDPEGYLFWSHGVVRVTPSSAVTPLDGHKFYFENLPKDSDDPFYQFYFTHDELLHSYYTARGIRETYDFSCANLYRKYGENYREKWYDLAHRRLRSWGINTIANSSDHALCLMDRTVYNERVDLWSSVEGYPEWPALKGSTGWGKFIDPFDELFETCVRAHLEANRRELDDPWCLGFFVDNEIKWGNESYLATLAFKSDPSQASKRVLINDLIRKYHNIEALNKAWKSDFKSWNDLYTNTQDPPKAAKADLKAFSCRIVEKYFSTVRTVFKQIAPDKLYMGCRFSRHPEFVVRICSKYVDVISYNIYAFDQASFAFPDGIDLPMMIGEFHFGALDRGMFHTGLISADNQEQRARIYQTYLRSCLENPNIVGTNWHQFSDQPTSGRFDGENFQVGFTSVCDTPYAETVAALREVGDGMYHIRSGNR